MKEYLPRKSFLTKSGVVLSIVLHILVFSIPVALVVRPPDPNKERKVELIFEKPRQQAPKPKPAPPKPKPKPKPVRKIKPRPKPPPEPPEPKQQAAEPKSPIEAAVADAGGIDIPTGPAYEEVYVPPPYVPACGNGVLDDGEECDDGNTTDGDGCAAGCALEYTPGCGNGVLDAGEECDDGNNADGDGCSAGCLDEVYRQNLLAEYQKSILLTIERNKKYPPAARRRGIQGAAKVRFDIAADGAVSGVALDKTSGYDILDREALATITRIGRFAPIPEPLDMPRMEISVAIVFRLQ